MKRHTWNKGPVCSACGTIRSSTPLYYSADGVRSCTAGPCIPGSPMQVESALRRAAAKIAAGSEGA